MSTILKIGEIIPAVVDQVEQYGIFLSYKNERIFIQIPDIDWVRKIPDPREFTQIGEQFNVKIIAFNEQKQIYSGSIREASPEKNPWKVPKKFEVGTVHQSRVILNTDYGSFVEIVPGVEALIPNDQGGGNIDIGAELIVQVVVCDFQLKKLSVKIKLM
jgi:ribosomal protein S1